jgi:LPS sulfotransferase NodH
MDDKRVFRLFKEVFGQPKYLWIRRRDKVRQAISFWKSKQTNVYASSRPAPSGVAKPVFDFGKIQGFVERFRRQDEAWGRLLERNGAQPLVLVYEEFSQRLEETVRQAMDHLGVERPTRLQVPRPRLEKLSDQLNEEWYERYHSMLSQGDVPESSNRAAAPVCEQV